MTTEHSLGSKGLVFDIPHISKFDIPLDWAGKVAKTCSVALAIVANKLPDPLKPASVTAMKLHHGSQ